MTIATISAAIQGRWPRADLIPSADGKLLHQILPEHPSDTEVLYHVMVGLAVLTFVKELGDFFGSSHPQVFGFIDCSRRLRFEPRPGVFGGNFWEAFRAMPRRIRPSSINSIASRSGQRQRRRHILPDDVSTYSHMFGCWETLYVIKQAMEAVTNPRPMPTRRRRSRRRRRSSPAREQRAFAGRQDIQRKDPYQCFGHQNISKVEGGKLNVVHRTSIEDGLYEPEADYTKMPL
jgi:branched-chain amino acid transport system substrate-binding protein